MNYLEKAKTEVGEWEKEKPSFLQKVGSVILAPAEKAAEKLIPAKVQEAVAKSIEGFLSFLTKQGPRTFDHEEIRKAVGEQARVLGGGKAPKAFHYLEAADERARHYWNWHIAYAAGEGGATGALGFLGLAADVPALFGILVRQIQEIGSCYGYDPDALAEREYLLHILRAGFASNVKLKMEFLVPLKQFEQVLVRVTWNQMAKQFAANEAGSGALLAALRQFAKTVGVQITKRKALQMIPLIGGLVGASLNATIANDVGKAAYMSYRRRWMQENEKRPVKAPAAAKTAAPAKASTRPAKASTRRAKKVSPPPATKSPSRTRSAKKAK